MNSNGFMKAGTLWYKWIPSRHQRFKRILPNEYN